MCWTYFLMSATICGRAALAPGGRTLGSQLPRGRPPTLEVRCAVTVWTSCRRSSSRACVQLSRGRGSSPSSAEVASGHARPRSACPAALRRSSTLLRTTQSWGGESDVGARAAHAGPPGPRPHQPAHWLAHCLACSPGLSVHLLPQQLSVEEGGLAQVLGWDERAQQLWAAGPGPAPLPDSCLLPDRAPQPTSTHLAELGAQRLGLSRVWPRQAGPQLLDVTEAEASSGCGAAVLGGGIHGLQLRRREEAWIAGRPWLSPAASGLGAYSLCPRPRLPEVSTWPGPAAPAARASRRAGRGRGCRPEQGSGCRCSRSPVRARPDSNTLSQHIPGSFPQRALGIPSRRPPRGGWRTAGWRDRE